MTMEMFAILMLHSFPYFAMGSSCVSGGDISFEKGHVGRLTCGTCNPGEIIPCGACSIEPDSGNPGADLKSLAMQGLTLSTPRSSLLQSASSVYSLNLSLDLMVKMVSFRGQPVNASLIVEFVDQDDTNVDQGYTSVFHDLGQIASGMAWRTVTAAIADIHSVDMPMGWQGSGAFHPALHTPMLPKNRTFASVIANTDVIRFTTFVPGMMYSTDLSFDVHFDNLVWKLGVACTDTTTTTMYI